MKNSYKYLIFPLIFFLFECTNDKKGSNEPLYPAMEGFNKEASDSAAISIADSVVKAMGGWESWEKTHYISWNFFDVRELVWDKWTGDVRINSLKNDFKAILNVHDLQGRVMINGEEVTNPDSLQQYLNQAKNFWINDSYWLVMPFKLKDSGVTLKYLGKETIDNAGPSYVLQLTFDNVGVTPDNKYKVWVDQNNHLVRQWAFFRSADQDTANFITPWNNYKKFGSILLSGDRGQRDITDIEIFNDLPEEVFNSFEPVDLNSLVKN